MLSIGRLSQSFKHCFPNFHECSNHLQILFKCRLWLSRSGQDLRSLISHELPGDRDAAGLSPVPRTHGGTQRWDAPYSSVGADPRLRTESRSTLKEESPYLLSGHWDWSAYFKTIYKPQIDFVDILILSISSVFIRMLVGN